MKPRVRVALFLIRLGRFVQSLAIMIMRPDDLIAFSLQSYAKPGAEETWGGDNVVNAGLTPDEISILNRIPLSNGRLLLLGVGGGREAVALGEKGFEVTGVDFVPQLVAKAKKNCAQRNVRFKGLVQEISKIDVPAASFDVVWLGEGMYSSVPTIRRRVEMLKRIRSTLKDDGYCICQFFWRRGKGFTPRVEQLRKVFRILSCGNIHYEEGDTLWHNIEFTHEFSTDQKLMDEFKHGGFTVEYIHISREWMRGGAILRPAQIGNVPGF